MILTIVFPIFLGVFLQVNPWLGALFLECRVQREVLVLINARTYSRLVPNPRLATCSSTKGF
jgi:hypothetical protein